MDKKIEDLLLAFRKNFISRYISDIKSKEKKNNKMIKENKFDDIIDAISKKYNVDFHLIKAMVCVESSFNDNAYRHEPEFYNRYILGKKDWIGDPNYSDSKKISASYGPMQIMYTTAKLEGWDGVVPANLHNPEINIDLGTKHLKRKITKYGLELGILAYNSGSPSKSNGDPRLEHNYVYLKKVAKFYKQFGGKNSIISAHAEKAVRLSH